MSSMTSQYNTMKNYVKSYSLSDRSLRGNFSSFLVTILMM
jgi:hypothetical protein